MENTSKNFYRLFIVAAATVLTVSFQNCSNANFSVDEFAQKAIADGRAAGDDGLLAGDGKGNRPGDDGNKSGGGGKDPNKEICESQLPPPPADRTPVAICPEATTVRFLAGQHHYVGDVSIAAQQDILLIKISLLSSVSMSETHVDVASSPEALETAPGQFRYKGSHSPAVSALTYKIPFSDLNLSLGQKIYARVHGVVQPIANQPNQAICGGETAWAEGVRNGIGWSMYVPLTIAECP